MSAFETMTNVQARLSSLRAPGWGKTWTRYATVVAVSGNGAPSFVGCGAVVRPDYTGEAGLKRRGSGDVVGPARPGAQVGAPAAQRTVS